MHAQPAHNAVHDLENLLFYTLLEIVIIIAAARLAGNLARRLGQPRAVGEIIAGLALGPSLAGALAPHIFQFVFHSVDAAPLTVMSQIGLILLMFQVGMDFDFSHLTEKRNRSAVIAVSAAGIAVPFILGLAFAKFTAATLAPGINPLTYSLFIATAFSITAVPILGRIMNEFGLNRTRLGAITISSAAINDVAGWTLLAAISAAATSGFSALEILRQCGELGVYLLGSWLLVRAMRRRIAGGVDAAAGLSRDMMVILLVMVFVSAMLTSEIGIFAIFGGFVMGVLLHTDHELVKAWKDKVADLVTVFFLPIFFTYSGLRTDITGLNSLELWIWCGLAVLLATLGKYGGCYLGARCAGISVHESRNIAILMNTRALMELIVLNVGRDLGVIPRNVFTMMVLMAIFTTVMTAPCLRRWLPRTGHRIPVGRDA
jgi:Kef-type K+ transport system membrane component KefB